MIRSEWDNNIIRRFESRFKSLEKPVAIILGRDYTKYWVAGSSLLADKPHDYDIYSEHGFNFLEIKQRIEKMKFVSIICETKNSLTVKINDSVVQFCSYKQPSLMALIETFDFAHVQIGLEVRIDWDEDESNSYHNSMINNLQFTYDWKQAMLFQNTYFTNSDYPLSSMFRIFKYIKRGLFKNRSYKIDMLNILTNIIARGYIDYADFKDQLAAIDLLLLEPEECAAARQLFSICCDRGLVRNPTKPEPEKDDYDF